MAKHISVTLEDDLSKALEQWMSAHGESDHGKVIADALKNYIEPRVVEDATMKDLEEHLPELMKEHNEAMDRLK